ncbi:TRF-like 8 [Hibiscus trionum]|uniref:TRF-like 8 n=1 Tax=Hibiscus trionum TaxID=183268 RepID=A0A9W7GUF5_HIBTR|nr:TRF-like 8 [Hibiscus trionum]
METDRKSHLIKKLGDVKCQRVDEYVVPGLEDEATEIEHFLAEPKTGHVSVDEILCFEKENLERHLKMEDYLCAFDYGWKISSGGLDCIHGQGGEDLKLEEVLDGLLDDDFLLDTEFPEKFSEPDVGPREVSSLESNSACGILESSIATIREPNSKNGKRVGFDLRHTFRSKYRSRGPVTDTVRPTREHVQDLDVSNNDEKPLASPILSNQKVKSSVKVTKGDTLLRQKRQRKPTRRYIEELSRNSTTENIKCRKVPSESRLWRGRPKKIVPKLEFESDSELSASEFEDEHKRTKRSKTACDRRKHQRTWTLAEVIKLVDGIAQYGVGRWTDIKKLLFASSAYRTPIDLRDKWRNLLRSSSAQIDNQREVVNKPKHPVRPLPKPVVRRILELATIHPYPKLSSSFLHRNY